MKFSLFENVKTAKGEVCTWPRFLDMTESKSVEAKANAIAHGSANKDRLKSSLPAVTWQAYFPNGKRVSAEAVPSGLYMLDIDHLTELPAEIYAKKIAGRLETLDIVAVHMTISTHGLRIVAQCQSFLPSIEANQRWLANELGLEYDGVCKDWARASFLVPFTYFYHINGAIFDEAFTAKFVLPNDVQQADLKQPIPENDAPPTPDSPQKETPKGIQTEYKGIALYDIAMEWLKSQGGLPEEGERNAKLYKLALRMRYICDFNAQVIAENIPRCGLQKAEVLQLCTSACGGNRSGDMPADMQNVLRRMRAENTTPEEIDEEEQPKEIPFLPPLPPVFDEYANIAPQDFKQATVLCLLPILGTLCSKIRAEYLNKRLETPSFMVALEAPQASGKSFIEVLTNQCLKPLIEKDEEERQKERAFEEAIKVIKMQGAKNTKAERQEIKEMMENKPEPLIRKMPATASITKLLMRMEQAQGLHLFALAVEIDTVAKAFKRGFSNLSDLLRCAFDNSEYGQDYASETSFSGNVKVFYNTLYSGTPAAVKHFYSNSEDGTLSRTLFVTLPDQFGKVMPVWGEFDKKQQLVVDSALIRLYETSIEGDDVKSEHIMKMDFLNNALAKWIEEQRQLSIKNNDRTRNTFYRRCAEVAFRAGMVAFCLYGEQANNSIRRKVSAFAIWVADMMLRQFMIRVVLSDDIADNLFARGVYNSLPDEFTRQQLQLKLDEFGFKSSVKLVLSRWRQAGRIKTTKYGENSIKKQKQ